MITTEGKELKGMSCCGVKAENYIYDECSKINNRRYKNDK